ncbi:MAG: hypothetical protein IJB45_04565 [Clostridia bacterium]|nr:hypothetical protein [Clostridia bacterium]
MKKTLSFILSLVFLVCALPTNAIAADAEMITGVTVNVDTDSMIGLTPADYEQFIEVVTPGLEIRQDEFVADTNSGTANTLIDVYTYGKGAWSTLYLYPAEGYSLPANADELTDGVKVRRKILDENDMNSKKPEYTIHSEDGVNGEYIKIKFSYAPTGPIKLIRSVDITFDSDIAGKTPEDFAEFFTVNTEGLEIRQDSFEAWFTDNTSVNPQRAKVLELGKTYHSTIYLYPKEGYAISGLISIPVTLKAESENGDNAVSYMDFETFQPNRYLISGLKISFAYRLTGPEPEPEPAGIAAFFQPLISFFEAIATFFTENLIQPLVDLFI